MMVSPTQAWRSLQKLKDKKISQSSISKDLFGKHKEDPSQKVELPKIEFQKVYLWTPITKLLLVHPVNLNLSKEDHLSLGKSNEQMYLRDQAIAYLSDLHISRATNIKMVADKVSLCLLVWDATKKKGFKLYYNEEMPTWKMRVDIVNFPHN